DLLVASGLKYTILRNGIYMDMLADIIGPTIPDSKTLFAAAGATPVAFTSRGNLAEAAAKVLLSTDFDNEVVDLVNVNSLGFPEIARQLGDVLQLDVTYVDAT